MKHLILSFVFCVSFLQTFAQTMFKDTVYAESDITTFLNLPYGNTHNGHSVLNFYSQISATSPSRPLIIMVPGSGFLNVGDPRIAFDTAAMDFAQRGYAVAVLDYFRVIDVCGTPFDTLAARAAADVYAAIQGLIAYKTTLKINTNYIFIHGQSAGGIAATTAIWLNDTQFSTFFNQSKNMSLLHNVTPVPYSIKALSLESSGVPFEEVFTQASTNANVPMIMYQGYQDPTVPFTCGTSNLCSISSIKGTGFIRKYIDLSPTRNNYYVMFEYICNQHAIGYLIGTKNMYQVIANFYYNILTNAPHVTSPQPIPTSRFDPNYVYPTCDYGFPNSRTGSFIEEANQNVSEESTANIYMNQKELMLSFANTMNATSNVSVYDMSGSLKKRISTETQSLSLAELPTGIYLVVVENDHQVYRKKIFLE